MGHLNQVKLRLSLQGHRRSKVLIPLKGHIQLTMNEQEANVELYISTCITSKYKLGTMLHDGCL